MVKADKALVRDAEIRAKINSLFARNPQVLFTVGAVAQGTGCKRSSVERLLLAMADAGQLLETGGGRGVPRLYSLPGMELPPKEPASLEIPVGSFCLGGTGQFVLYNEALLLFAAGEHESKVWLYLFCAVAFFDGIFPDFYIEEGQEGDV